MCSRYVIAKWTRIHGFLQYAYLLYLIVSKSKHVPKGGSRLEGYRIYSYIKVFLPNVFSKRVFDSIKYKIAFSSLSFFGRYWFTFKVLLYKLYFNCNLSIYGRLGLNKRNNKAKNFKCKKKSGFTCVMYDLNVYSCYLLKKRRTLS